MSRTLACAFCLSTLAQGAPLLEKNGTAICRTCAEGFFSQFAEHAWTMAATLEEQLDVLLAESQRALEHSAALSERARSCGLSLHDLTAAMRPRLLS
ncbi:MSHA biogenesis protein MshH [Achromobacter sp. 413638]|uniref:MSHA biogenesis protein MshH n=1 Tax=Achromobacter sp. 413638 TaxID=3342385 RepID=UPI00370C3A4B